MWKKTELPKMIEAIAGYREFGPADRLPLWEERLRVNELELRQFAQAPEVEPEPIMTAPRPVRTDGPAFEGALPAGEGESALATASSVRRKEVSALEIATRYIERAQAVADMNLFTAFDSDDLLRQARQVDAQIARGEDPGALAGVPVPVKDFMFVRGYPRTGGTRAMTASRDHEDCDVVANVRAAGALVGGVTNLHELAYGATGINPHFGRVHNPRHPQRIIGGSSSGSAGAVAAGLSPVAIGTDTSGSIRIPSAFAGVVGFKPTYGNVSREGVMPLAWSLDHVGPIAGCVADAAMAYAVMAGLPPEQVVPNAGHGASRIRFGRPTNHFFTEVDVDILDRIEKVLDALAHAGHGIVPVALPGVEACLPIHVQTVSAEASQAYWRPLVERPDVLGEDVRVRLEAGQFLASIDYVKAQRMRTGMRDMFQSAFRDVDVLVTPTVAVPAPAIGAVEVVIDGVTRPLHPALTRFTTPFNQTGLPAITLPCGTNSDGLPLGLQLSAAHGNDAVLLACAAAVERAILEM